MEKNDIYIIQGEDYKQMTLNILRAVRLAEDIGDRNKRIGVKPNILGAKKAKDGAVTHPELVDGVLAYLQEEGFYNIVVLEGSWVGDVTSRAVKTCGIYDVCIEHNVPFIDLQKDSSKTLDASGMMLSVCDKALELDYLINIPVVKGHCQTMVTCALKNSKGLIPNFEKRRFHTLGLHKPIAHLNTVIHQDFILADNICGDLDFEDGGNPVVMNRILAFKDPVLCDSFAAESIGYHPYDIGYIRIAEQLGVGSTNVAGANIIFLNEGGFDIRKTHHTQRVSKLAEYASPVVSCGNQTGEGWFLTAEMIELINSGVPNIVCAQPFGCLPNHVVGKGVIKELRNQFPDSNIVAVDYDPGATEVNQLNRIKLMLSTAVKNLD